MKVWAKTAEYPEGKYLVVRRDGTVPEWPHFVLGGFDPCAEAALHAYAHEAARRGLEVDYTQSVHELAVDFGLLATTPAAVAKADPDAPPHRHDNPAVLAMMRGEIDLANYPGAATWRLPADGDWDGRWLLGAWRGSSTPDVVQWADGEWKDERGEVFGSPDRVRELGPMPTFTSGRL